jgi:hypothetical protein
MIPASFPSDPVEPRAMQSLLALQSSHSFHNPTTRGICIAFIARRLRHILGPPSAGQFPVPVVPFNNKRAIVPEGGPELTSDVPARLHNSSR